jgi:hypothetical protein
MGFEVLKVVNRSRDSSVGIVMGDGLDDRGSIPGRGKLYFSSPQRPDRLSAHPAF